ncbi:MAG TPA: DUF4126 domain-containing protein [Ktedonobacterales bacterium]|jgi:hypothetical protein
MDPLSITTTTIASVVLSSSSGLRAYLPLFALGIAVIAGVVPLEHGYEILTNPLVLGALGVLSVLEIVADKVPAVDHVSDIIHTVIRPVMGGLIFANTDNLVSVNNGVVAAIIGAALAGGMHGVKALSRPVVTATTAGVGNPVVSIIEDVAVIGLVVLAVIVPVVALILLILLVALFALLIRWAWRKLRRRKQQKQAASVAGTGTGIG